MKLFLINNYFQSSLQVQAAQIAEMIEEEGILSLVVERRLGRIPVAPNLADEFYKQLGSRCRLVGWSGEKLTIIGFGAIGCPRVRFTPEAIAPRQEESAFEFWRAFAETRTRLVGLPIS